MHDDRDDLAFAAKPLFDINAVVDAYCEADAVRQVAERLFRSSWDQAARATSVDEMKVAKRHNYVCALLNKWADAREASVAAMLEG